MDAIEHIRQWVRWLVRHVARAVNAVSGGHITPNMVTWLGLLLHLIIAWLIVQDQLVVSGLLLILFGLFDTLDGELARVQDKTSDFGTVLDATSDRIKEGLLYSAFVYRFSQTDEAWTIWVALAALVSSFAVSYVKAKAETVIVRHSNSDVADINRHFNQGFARFEVRMAILVLGLLFNQLVPALGLVTFANLWTYGERLIRIRSEIS